MRAENEQELEKKLVGIIDALGETAEAVLAADLAEFAGPVGEDGGKPGVGEGGIGGAAAAVEAPSQGPAAVEPVVERAVEAEGVLGLKECARQELVAVAPEKFIAPENGMIDGAAKRLPAKGGVGAVEIGEEAGAELVVAAGVGDAKIEIGGFGKIAIGAEVSDDGDILPAGGLEEAGGVAAENLRGAFEEPVLWSGQNAGEGEAGVVDAIFAADEIHGGEGTVNEAESMVVDGVDLAEAGAHLADSGDEAGREPGEGDVALFDIDAGFAEREEEIAAGVGVNDGLDAELGFVHLEAGRRSDAIVPGGGDEIADHADVGIEELGVTDGAAIGLGLLELGRGRNGS